jgi:hypothetical protein
MTGLKHHPWVWLVIGAAVAAQMMVWLAIVAGHFVDKNHTRAHESLAAANMLIAVKAAANYHAKFGVYAPALQDLTDYEEGWTPHYSHDPVFTGEDYYYVFHYEAPLSSAGTRDKFFLRAVPEEKDARQFCADQSGRVRIARKGTACTTSSDELPEPDKYGWFKIPQT